LLARLLRDCSKDFLVAVIEQGALVGYCVASIEGKLAHLISIAVAREYRRQGVGAALMAASIENLGARTAELGLEVKEGNVEAIRLYAKFGFRTLNLIRNYYADGSSAVKMRLTLPAAKQVESGGAG
jgi:ribosomal-protein-alanine N-acetyltransferase